MGAAKTPQAITLTGVSSDDKPLIGWRMLTLYLSLAAVAVILVAVGVASSLAAPTEAEVEPVGVSEPEPVDVAPSSIAQPSATPTPAPPAPEPVAAPAPAPAPAPVTALAPAPAQPAAPACPTGSVDFAVYHADLTPLHAVDGSISGYGATVVVTAANRTTEPVYIRYGSGAWGVDAAGNHIIPVAADWSAAGTINPRTQVGATGQNRFVTVEQAAAVTSWTSSATGYAVVEWLTAPPAGCAARPVVTG